MVDNVINFPIRKGEMDIEVNMNVSPDHVLQEADAQELDTVVVLGFNGDTFYGTSSDADPAQVVLMMEKAKMIILENM